MGKPDIKLAQLDEAQIAAIGELEEELGTWIVALEPVVRLADLADHQLERLQAKEKELGVVLLAYATDK